MRDKRASAAAPILAVFAIVLALLPMLYVLSVGPAAWLISEDYISNDSAEVFYAPIIAVVESNSWLQGTFERYIRLFIGHQ